MQSKKYTLKNLSTLMLAICLLLLPMLSTISVAKANAVETLTIYNCEDYLDTDYIIDEEGFSNWYYEQTGKRANIEYNTFGTNEIMYNDIKINNKVYDLICPSDYMIEKMAREGMLEKLDHTKLTTYNSNASPYIIELFKDASWQKEGIGESLYDYAVCYMWGTLGLVYNEEVVRAEDVATWENLWNISKSCKITIKDSVRDSYFLGVAYAYKEELNEYADKVKNGVITQAEYELRLKEILNRTDDTSIMLVEEGLKVLKDRIYGFEVDAGKSDVATGKIDINFAWSGDAVYAIDQGDEAGRTLKYYVPNEGSNIWFDGWVMQKGANTELAYAFLNYVSSPQIAARNMYNVGYTSSIIGNESFVLEYEDDEVYDCTGILDYVMQYYDVSDVQDETYVYPVDLSYFFGNNTVLYSAEKDRQFMAQYPSQEIVNRCAVMQYFDDEKNVKILEMWERVKGVTLPTYVIVLIVVLVVVVIILILIYKYKQNIKDFIDSCTKEETKKAKRLNQTKKSKKLKVISIEKIQ